jgi:ABC-type spermidine/putrescine transport system permease subunit II
VNLEGPLTVPKALLYGVVGLTLFFLILPNFIVIPISFSTSFTLKFPPPGFSLQWFEAYFTSPRWMSATWNSFHVAIFTTLVSVTLGSLAAFGLVRGSFPGKRILNSFFLIPIIIPHLVIAVAIYRLFSNLGLLGSTLGFVIGHSMIAIPFVITIMSAVLRGIDVNLENAARVLGASRLRSIWHVTFPLAFPGMISSALFAFLVSFDELMIALFLSSPTMTTLPKRLWDGIRMEMEPTLGAVATFLVVVSMVVLGMAAVARYLMQRRMR